MKEPLASFALAVMLTIFAHSAFADAHKGPEAGRETQEQTPRIIMNIGVEINGLETAAEEAAQGLNLIGEALQDLANNPELTAEHEQTIQQALNRVDGLGKSLTIAIDQLPATLDKSVAPLVDVSHDLSSQIKQTIVITAISLIVILMAALAAAYYFLLAPGTQSVIETTALLNELANTLKTTAEIVEKSSERNLQVMEEMRSLRNHS